MTDTTNKFPLGGVGGVGYLSIDLGNTYAKTGLFEGSNLIETQWNLTYPELVSYVRNVRPERIMVSSVSYSEEQLRTEFSDITSEIYLLKSTTPVPIKKLYDTPETLGADRVAAAVGARVLFPDKSCVVIDMGTCITYDLVGLDDNFYGGIIAPGVRMRFKAMNTFTKRLPLLEPEPIPDGIPELIGKSTKHAMQSGVMNLGSVFGVNIGTFVAGLGIGGLAIALAARETLENLFASFTLFLDLPFVVGDKIQLDKVLGKVEKIGFRSTRIRTREGSLVTVPNRLITAQSLENQTKREFMGVEYVLRLPNTLSVAVIEEIVVETRKYINKHEMVYQSNLSMTHFQGFFDNFLEILVSYNISTNSLRKMREVREEVNLEILRIIEQSKNNHIPPPTPENIENNTAKS